MKFVLDTHCHTIASGHAYSTLQEMAIHGAHIGLELLSITDHGPTMPGGPHLFYFSNLRAVPKYLFGVEILRGAEINILNHKGELDIPEEILKTLDLGIASFHPPCIDPGSREQNTQTLLQVMKNPYVHIIGHSGSPKYPIDIQAFVQGAKDTHTLIEVNNSSLQSHSVRAGSNENCLEIMKVCRDLKVPISIGSDAHISFDIGKFETAQVLLEELNMPEELIANTSVERFKSFLARKR